MNDFNDYINTKCLEYINALESPDQNKANNLRKRIIGQACSSLPKISRIDEFKWFEDALKDDRNKWFVQEVFKKHYKIPESLLMPFIVAGMNEKDVSRHGYLIQPCVKTFGEGKVLEILNNFILTGNEEEKLAAKDLLYWVSKF